MRKAFQNGINKRLLIIVGVLTVVLLQAKAQNVYTIQTKQTIAPVPKTLWGLFFEDINRAADGGVYAEMAENRSFDFPKPMTAWETWPKARLKDGIFLVMNQSAENAADPKYMKITTNVGDTVGLINYGFDEGMAFKKGLSYDLSLRYRQLVRTFRWSRQTIMAGIPNK
jgi:alpha-N-arabinofuranosidase